MQNFLGTVINGLLCLAVIYGIHYFLQRPFKSVVGIFFVVLGIALLYQFISWIAKLVKGGD
ncbi:hypothetical protein AYI84_18825 [Shewanella algae]|nr:hypothetical protein AYI84_18825 [Shewanella algae]TVL47865.1 hypothetical protein AYI99_10690 [Shewanella algae]